jgi:hypothetical protein
LPIEVAGVLLDLFDSGNGFGKPNRISISTHERIAGATARNSSERAAREERCDDP